MKERIHPWPVSLAELSLLCALRAEGQSSLAAAALGVHESVVSRRLQTLARRVPVVTRSQGRWRLTVLGERILSWYQDSEYSLRQLLGDSSGVRIATTSEFSARILCPELTAFLAAAPGPVRELRTDGDIEALILSGAVDVGIECGRPSDPSIRFRRVFRERFDVVASPRFLARHQVSSAQQLEKLPYVESTRLQMHRVLERPETFGGGGRQCVVRVTELSAQREACRAGIGWTILPSYSVARELEDGSLKVVSGWRIREEAFGIWWLADRRALAPWIDFLTSWLKAQGSRVA